MAEGIFNHLAAEKNIQVTAESMGISAYTGFPISENSVKACAEHGIDISQKTSTYFADKNLSDCDKFYCMSQGHKDFLVKECAIPAEKIEVLNVCDPYMGSIEVYRECFDEIYNSVKEIIKAYED